MDIITLSLAKKYANKVAAGFSSVQVDGSNLIFTLNDGTKATMTIPAPENGSDGISVVDLSIDTDGSLLCHMSDGSTIDAGKVPMIEPEHVQPDWSQNDSTQPDYVKNRFGGYEDYERTIILEETELTFTKRKANDLGIDKTTVSFMTIDMVIDGISHVAVQDISGAMQIIYNGYSTVGTHVQYSYDADRLTLLDGFEDGTHTVAIYGLSDEPVAIKIPEKYLPDTIATKEYVNNMFNSIVNGDEVSY